MKKNMVLTALLGLALGGCGVNIPLLNTNAGAAKTPAPVVSAAPVAAEPTPLAERHWSDVAKIRAEAQRLRLEVQKHKITRVQAAQKLNALRLKLVGHNTVDDSVYDVYLRAATNNQRDTITPEESRKLIVDALSGWQQRWQYMSNRPSNPAFTNFFLEYMGMETLR